MVLGGLYRALPLWSRIISWPCPGSLLAIVGEELVHADNLPMQRAGNQRIALYFAGLCIGNRDVIHLQGSPHGSLVTGLGFGEARESADFVALRSNEVALRLNDQVNGGGAKLILFLLGVEGLLLKLARFAGRSHLRAELGQRDVALADVQDGGIAQLLHLRFELPLHQQSANVKSLRRTVAQGKGQGQGAGVDGKLIVKDLVLRRRETFV